MINSLGLIHRLHEHRVWANHTLFDAAAALTDTQLHQAFDIGQGSVWATLVHLYGAEHVWYEAMVNNVTHPVLTAPGTPDAPTSLDDLRTRWDELEARWAGFLEKLTVRRLSTYQVRKVGRGGTVSSVPTYDVLLHVCLHANYTAAQCANMLRHLGAPVPDASLITLSRTQADADEST